MKLESDGILISLHPIGEIDSTARIFTRNHGMLCGVMRGAVVARKNKPLVGQIGGATWNARLDSQLGSFHWESVRNAAAPLMMRPSTLMKMNAAFDLMAQLLPERESYTGLYDATLELLAALANDVPGAYLRWELVLLRELGYALDLSRCSGCGGTENLVYLSPRTGRAVCADCGAPYAGRLYGLPVSVSTTLKFIEQIFDGLNISVPHSRKIIFDT